MRSGNQIPGWLDRSGAKVLLLFSELQIPLAVESQFKRITGSYYVLTMK